MSKKEQSSPQKIEDVRGASTLDLSQKKYKNVEQFTLTGDRSQLASIKLLHKGVKLQGLEGSFQKKLIISYEDKTPSHVAYNRTYRTAILDRQGVKNTICEEYRNGTNHFEEKPEVKHVCRHIAIEQLYQTFLHNLEKNEARKENASCNFPTRAMWMVRNMYTSKQFAEVPFVIDNDCIEVKHFEASFEVPNNELATAIKKIVQEMRLDLETNKKREGVRSYYLVTTNNKISSFALEHAMGFRFKIKYDTENKLIYEINFCDSNRSYTEKRYELQELDDIEMNQDLMAHFLDELYINHYFSHNKALSFYRYDTFAPFSGRYIGALDDMIQSCKMKYLTKRALLGRLTVKDIHDTPVIFRALQLKRTETAIAFLNAGIHAYEEHLINANDLTELILAKDKNGISGLCTAFHDNFTGFKAYVDVVLEACNNGTINKEIFRELLGIKDKEGHALFYQMIQAESEEVEKIRDLLDNTMDSTTEDYYIDILNCHLKNSCMQKLSLIFQKNSGMFETYIEATIQAFKENCIQKNNLVSLLEIRGTDGHSVLDSVLQRERQKEEELNQEIDREISIEGEEYLREQLIEHQKKSLSRKLLLAFQTIFPKKIGFFQTVLEPGFLSTDLKKLLSTLDRGMEHDELACCLK